MIIKKWESALAALALVSMMAMPAIAQNSTPMEQLQADPVGFFILNALKGEKDHYKTPERIERARIEGNVVQYCFTMDMLAHTFNTVDDFKTVLPKDQFTKSKNKFFALRESFTTTVGEYSEAKTCSDKNKARIGGYSMAEVGRMAGYHWDYAKDDVVGFPSNKAQEFLGGLPMEVIDQWTVAQRGDVTMIKQPATKRCAHLWVAKSILDKAPNIKMSGHGVSRQKLNDAWEGWQCKKRSFMKHNLP